jgi:hypothetical protein
MAGREFPRSVIVAQDVASRAGSLFSPDIKTRAKTTTKTV